jgi:hypothetical protein
MKKAITSILIAGIAVLAVSMILLYAVIYMMPGVMEEYYNDVFRSTSFQTDWMFYVHPFVLSISLYWFWDRFKEKLGGSWVVRAVEIALVYCVVAMLPVLWLTFSAINISFAMVITWLGFGALQAFVAGLVFAKQNP